MDTERKNLPIGIFDSGVGGLSVLRTALRLLPGERFIYYGDIANAPYGTKSEEEVRACADRVAKQLLDQGVKALVIACNTATCAAAAQLREKYPQLIIIGMEPAAKLALDLEYISGITFRMDIKLLLRTAKIILFGGESSDETEDKN